MRNTLLYIVFSLFYLTSFGQKKRTIVDKTKYDYDTSITQNKCSFSFWTGSIDSTRNRLIIEKVYKNKHSIIYNDFIKDNSYELTDINDDGFLDLITFYHEKDMIHFYNSKVNLFSEDVVAMPSEHLKIDKKDNLYCGYQETMYGDKYSYSILYKYKDSTPIFLYKLVYITKEGYETIDKVNQIKLYKFKKNDYSKPEFVETIKTKNPSKFDYKSYWKKNYKRILGSS